MSAGLYIHIPFCVRKCEYCDFVSGVAAESDIDRYLAALERELALRFPEGLRPATIFMGGGTPTRLGAPQLHKLGEILARHVDLSTCREFTSEINPGTLTQAKVEALAALGVDRASLGVQSFHPRFLEGLGRAYEAGTATTAVEMIRAAGIVRLSMDLMFALPGQSLAELNADIDAALAHDTEHVSLYALTYEDDTPLTRQLQDGSVQPCPEELEREMFAMAGRRLAETGRPRYEVSNYARPGAECMHNLNYWTLGDWHGVGAAAHGLMEGVIERNGSDWRAYCDALESGRSPMVEREVLSAPQRAESLLLMGLRLARGVELARFERYAGAAFATVCGEPAGKLLKAGLLEIVNDHVRCTREGMFVLDEIIARLAIGLEAAT